MNILQINGSARSEGANSTRVANGIVARLLAAGPQARVVLRDLARDPAPIIDEAALGALFSRSSSARRSRLPASPQAMR